MLYCICNHKKPMNKILIGIKPDVTSNLKSFNQSADVIKCIARFFGEYFYRSGQNFINSPEFISDLYEGNKHQESCVEHYGTQGWYFFVLETELPFSQINYLKPKLRKKLKKYAIKSEHPADNCIHISDSAESAEREILLFKNYSK